jgi:hypothetical protein
LPDPVPGLVVLRASPGLHLLLGGGLEDYDKVLAVFPNPAAAVEFDRNRDLVFRFRSFAAVEEAYQHLLKANFEARCESFFFMYSRGTVAPANKKTLLTRIFLGNVSAPSPAAAIARAREFALAGMGVNDSDAYDLLEPSLPRDAFLSRQHGPASRHCVILFTRTKAQATLLAPLFVGTSLFTPGYHHDTPVHVEVNFTLSTCARCGQPSSTESCGCGTVTIVVENKASPLDSMVLLKIADCFAELDLRPRYAWGSPTSRFWDRASPKRIQQAMKWATYRLTCRDDLPAKATSCLKHLVTDGSLTSFYVSASQNDALLARCSRCGNRFQGDDLDPATACKPHDPNSKDCPFHPECSGAVLASSGLHSNMLNAAARSRLLQFRRDPPAEAWKVVPAGTRRSRKTRSTPATVSPSPIPVTAGRYRVLADPNSAGSPDTAPAPAQPRHRKPVPCHAKRATKLLGRRGHRDLASTPAGHAALHHPPRPTRTAPNILEAARTPVLPDAPEKPSSAASANGDGDGVEDEDAAGDACSCSPAGVEDGLSLTHYQMPDDTTASALQRCQAEEIRQLLMQPEWRDKGKAVAQSLERAEIPRRKTAIAVAKADLVTADLASTIEAAEAPNAAVAPPKPTSPAAASLPPECSVLVVQAAGERAPMLGDEKGAGEFVCCGRPRCCERAIRLANVDDVQDEHGHTALMCASGIGHHECVDRLLRVGADKEARDNGGTTALMLASQEGHPECVDHLLRAGADKNAKDNEGWTAMMLSSAVGHPECIDRLLCAGADKDLQTSCFDTASSIASHGAPRTSR